MDVFDGSVKPLAVNEVKFRFIRITRFLPGRFPKSSDFRARLWGAAIRFLLKMGFTVGLVGYRRKQQKIMELIAYFPCVRGLSVRRFILLK